MHLTEGTLPCFHRLILIAAPGLGGARGGAGGGERGRFNVKRDAMGNTIFDFDERHCAVDSRKNDDVSLSFIAVSLSLLGVELVVGPRAGQHEHVFTER